MKQRFYLPVVCAIAVLVLSCNSLLAQVKFYASAGKQVPVNQGLQLNYTVENGEAQSIKLPQINDFQVVSGPNTMQNVSIVNGHMSRSTTYSYVLKPKKEGTYKIGKAVVNVDGANLESNELTVEVTGPVQQARQRSRDPFEDMFMDDPFEEQQQEPQVNKAEIEKEVKNNVFLRLVASDNSVYAGEQITASLKLYFNCPIAQVQLSKAPTFDGFWNQEVQMDPNKKPDIEEYNGKKYNVVELQKYNLFPQRSGALKITGAELATIVQVQVRGGRRSFWDMFGGVQAYNVPHKCLSNEVTINVKEPPVAGRPANYNGAVGNLKFETSLSSANAKTDEPVTYTVKISGSGNLKLIDAPTLELSDAFEVYDPKVKENVAGGGAGLSGSKQYDFLIVPRQPGDFKIPANSFSYFSPSANKYITITSPEYALKVTGEPSKNTSSVLPVAGAQNDVTALGSDIRYIKTTVTGFEKESDSLVASAGFAAAYTSPFLLLIALAAVKRRNRNMEMDVIGMKRRRATKLAQKRLSLARKHLGSGSRQLFYDEVSKAIWGYLGDKLNIDLAMLSKENVEGALLARHANHATVARLQSLLNTCELALYAPVGEGGEMKQNYEVAVNLIADLEDEVKA
jgi:hypothetical protein